MEKIIAGRKPVMEALRAGTRIEAVYFLLGVKGTEINEIKSMAQEKGVLVRDIGKSEFRELAIDTTTQGVVAVIPTRKYVGLDALLEIPQHRGEKGFLLILDEIEDPHNLGALVRTAECAGVHGIVLPKHHAAHVTSTVTKTSAGATEHMAIAEVTNVVSTLERLKEEGYWVVGLDGSAQQLFTRLDYASPVALVVGNEGKGIRRLVKAHCDHLVKIPLHGKIQSLNASVAGALVMFEVARKRSTL